MEVVPMSQVEILLPIDSIRKLPVNAIYHRRSNQAEISVRTTGDTVIITAKCDSIQRMCEYYENVAFDYKNSYDALLKNVETEEKQSTNSFKRILIAFLAGVATGLTVLIILKIKKT